MKITLRLIGLFGVLLFGLLLLTMLVSPMTVEESAREFVKYQVEKEIVRKQHIIMESTTANRALGVAKKLGLDKGHIQDDLDHKLSEKISIIVASMCGYNCEKEKLLVQSIASNYLERIKNIQLAENKLIDAVKSKYIEIVRSLKSDLFIFLGANCLMFVSLLAVSFAKPNAIVHLFLPGLLLLAATTMSSAIYVFGQNWFYTILYNDYMGFGYLAYLAVIFGVLVDISFNKARITTKIINSIANVLVQGFLVVPC